MNLEQLIEVCGDWYHSTKLVKTANKKRKYRAVKKGGFNWFYGSTPTEAVQKLYDYLKENNLLNNN